MKSKLIFKTVLLIIIGTLIQVIQQSISPVISNELALSQMSNGVDSSMQIQTYSQLSEYSWIIILLLAVIIFHKEIIKLTKTIKEKQGEKKNEEI